MQRPTYHVNRSMLHFTLLLLLLRLLLANSPEACQEVKGYGAVEERLDGDVGRKKRRQVFRQDVSPFFGGRVPSAAFDWARLMLNNLDSRGISIPDGKFPSSDRLSGGRSDEERIMLFSGDMLKPHVPTTYVLRKPVDFSALALNQYHYDQKMEENDDEEDEVESNTGDDYHNHYHNQNKFLPFAYECGFQRRCSGSKYSSSRPINSDETDKTQEYNAGMTDYEKKISSTYEVGNEDNKGLFLGVKGKAKLLMRSEGDGVGVTGIQGTTISTTIRGAQHSRLRHQDLSDLFTRLPHPFLANYETRELLPAAYINDRNQHQFYRPLRQFSWRYGFPMGRLSSRTSSSENVMEVVKPERVLGKRFIPIKNILKILLLN